MSFHLTKSIDMNGQQIIDHGSPLQNTQAHHYDSYGLTEANTRNIKEPADSKFHQDKNEKNLKLSSDLKQSVSSEPLLNSNNIHAGESTKDLSAKFSLRYGPTSFGWLPDSSKDKKSTDSLGLKTHSYLFDEKQLHHNLSLDFQHENVDPDRQYHDIGLLFGVFPISIHWYDWFYPPSTPRECQLLRWENLAVPLCYLTVGLLQGLSGPFVNVYPLDLGATQAQQVTLSCLRVLPASFKILFGFWSDTLPLYGYRRKSYMAVGWAVCSMSMWALVMLSDLKIYPDYETDEGTKTTTFVVGNEAPSIPFLSACLLGFGTGLWFADVMADSVVAEKAKLEPEDSRGHLLSTCYACRFFGLMVAAPLSAITYSSHGPRFIVILMALLPISILPSVYYLWEIRYVPIKPMVAQCNEIWDTVCSRAVWQPMGFVYLYNILQVGNAAWREYLFSVLGFTANQLNTLLIMAYVLLYLGILTYKYYLIHWSWRSIYITTTLLNGFFSALQVLLIYGITFGMDPFWFALGDDVFADFISGIQFLPTTIMMVHLCPSGNEGASYAMFTTVNNSAQIVSSAISTQLLSIWDVSKSTMLSGDLTGLTKLTIFTTLLQTSALLFVRLLPQSKKELDDLKSGGSISNSGVGGLIFLLVTFFSMFYAIFVGIMNILFPGWSGESR